MGFRTRSRLFCCFLPVELGAYVMAVITIMMSLMPMMLAGVEAGRMRKGDSYFGVAVLMLYFGLLIAVSLFGFVGCHLRKPKFIRVYSIILNTLLVLSLIGGIIVLYALYAMSRQYGTRTMSPTRGRTIITIWSILMWIVQIYNCWITRQYIHRLFQAERAVQRNAQSLPKSERKEVV